MKTLALLLALALLPALAGAEEVWRWTDSRGTTHYTNRAKMAPAEATPVKTRLIVEAKELPRSEPDLVVRDGMVIDAREARREAPPATKAPHRIYSERRRRFGCYAADILFAGGWAHPDDIGVQGNCLPYLLGPEAWLNAAHAELGLREHGIDWRQVVPMYLASPGRTASERLISVNDSD